MVGFKSPHKYSVECSIFAPSRYLWAPSLLLKSEHWNYGASHDRFNLQFENSYRFTFLSAPLFKYEESWLGTFWYCMVSDCKFKIKCYDYCKDTREKNNKQSPRNGVWEPNDLFTIIGHYILMNKEGSGRGIVCVWWRIAAMRRTQGQARLEPGTVRV